MSTIYVCDDLQTSTESFKKYLELIFTRKTAAGTQAETALNESVKPRLIM